MADMPAPDDNAPDEITLGLTSLMNQAMDTSIPPVPRIQAVISARAYLDGLTRRLVNDARENGSTWEEIAVLFGTSPINAKARYGDYNDYD